MALPKVIKDRVLIKRADLKDTYHGVIATPEVGQQPSYEGTVQAVGPKVKEIAVGDHVLYERHAGTEMFQVGLEGYVLLPEAQIIGILG
jgi:co-chaperonin GroES (HSP10)